jgi:hypothetical protein
LGFLPRVLGHIWGCNPLPFGVARFDSLSRYVWYNSYMTCNYCSTLLTGKQTKWCSHKCRVNFYVIKSRRTRKQKLVDHFGGKCILCGYNKYIGALHFHHTEDNKEFGLSTGITRSWEKDLTEASKCILVCANCHAEQHSHIA